MHTISITQPLRSVPTALRSNILCYHNSSAPQADVAPCAASPKRHRASTTAMLVVSTHRRLRTLCALPSGAGHSCTGCQGKAMASPVACSRTPDSCCWGLRVLTVPLEAAVSNQLATCGVCVRARACVTPNIFSNPIIAFPIRHHTRWPSSAPAPKLAPKPASKRSKCTCQTYTRTGCWEHVQLFCIRYKRALGLL